MECVVVQHRGLGEGKRWAMGPTYAKYLIRGKSPNIVPTYSGSALLIKPFFS